MASTHPINGAVFKVAMHMGFGLVEHQRLGLAAAPVPATRTYVQNHIAVCKPRWSRCHAKVIHMEPYGGKVGEWIRGETFELPEEENGKHIEFFTQSISVLRQEVAHMKEQRRLAEAALDPKPGAK